MTLKRRLLLLALRYKHRFHGYRWVRVSRMDTEPKIFCLSMQRTGTTSVGRFLRDFGFRTAGWPLAEKNAWPELWYQEQYDTIFSSIDFRVANAYEDAPWWYPAFYERLYHRFPGSRFVLFERDPDAWFDSMLKHSNGDILGKTKIHARIYRREEEYDDLLRKSGFDVSVENQYGARKTMQLVGNRDHYTTIYEAHNLAVRNFFANNAPHALYADRLENAEKWQMLGAFLGIPVSTDYHCHQNASRKINNASLLQSLRSR